jgi:hypothetical protein
LFKLSELFVSIKAKDDELKKQLGGVKDQLTSTAKAVSSSVTETTSNAVRGMTSGLGAAGVALGTAIGGGVVGIVTKMAEVVTNFIKETIQGSEELTGSWNELTATFSEIITSITGTAGTVKEQLSGMFAPAIKGGLEFVTHYLGVLKGIVELAKPYIEAAKEGLTSIVAKAQPYFDAFQAGVTVVFFKIGIANQSGVAYFYKIKTAVMGMAGPVIAQLQKIPGYISAAFGSSQVQTVAAWGVAVKEWVIDKVELAGVFIRNWPDFFEIAAIEINQQINNIGAVLNTIPENAQIVGNYLAKNWKELIIDAISAVEQGFINLGENIGNLAISIRDFFQGKGWHFDFKPLLEGFKATADQLPELAKPKFQDVSSQAIKEINDKIAQQELNRKPFKLDVQEKKKVAEEVAAKQSEGFKSRTLGVADVRADIISGILNKDKDDVPKAQLKTQERIAKAAEDTATEVKKPAKARFG